MAIRQIIKLGDEVLRKTCKPVEVFDKKLGQLLEDMRDTMYKNEGVGLAANQVGILKRVVVIDVGEGLVELINPVIEERDGSQVGPEGCLSVPGNQQEVVRPNKVVVRALDRHGKPIKITAEEYFARAVCHEVDHLDGILYIDRVNNKK